MWYACSSHIQPEVVPICTLAFPDRDLLWKHLDANHIHYAKISAAYDVFEDGHLRYTIDIGTFPLEKSKKAGVIIAVCVIALILAGLIAFTVRFIPFS